MALVRAQWFGTNMALVVLRQSGRCCCPGVGSNGELGCSDGVFAVCRFRDDLPSVMGLENRPHTRSDYLVVVRDQNPRHGSPSLLAKRVTGTERPPELGAAKTVH